MAEEQNQEDSVSKAEFGNMSNIESPPPSGEEQQKNLEMLYDIPVNITAELGASIVTIKDLLNFSPGSVVELDRLAGEPIDIKINGVLVGKADVVIVNENFGLRVSEIVTVEERLKKLTD